MRNRYVVWGYGRSWIVHRVDAAGRIVWCSEWMSNSGAARAELGRLQDKDGAR